MADMQVGDVRELIDGLRWDRRRHPYRGRREYSQRAQAVAAAVADMIEAGDAASAGPLARRAVERVTAALMYAAQQPGGAVESAPNQHLVAVGYQAHQAQNTRHGSFGIKSF